MATGTFRRRSRYQKAFRTRKGILWPALYTGCTKERTMQFGSITQVATLRRCKTCHNNSLYRSACYEGDIITSIKRTMKAGCRNLAFYKMNNRYIYIFMVAMMAEKEQTLQAVSEQSSLVTGGQSRTGQFKLHATSLIPTRLLPQNPSSSSVFQ